jgi:hypothetical protein
MDGIAMPKTFVITGEARRSSTVAKTDDLLRRHGAGLAAASRSIMRCTASICGAD